MPAKTNTSKTEAPAGYRNIETLVLWKDNYNEGDVGALEIGIRRYGFAGALRVWRNNVVMGGNHTLKALWNAKRAGQRIGDKNPWPPKKVFVADDGSWWVNCVDIEYLSETEAIAFAVWDNRSSQLATQDEQKLFKFLTEIREFDMELAGATGYDDEDYSDLAALIQDVTPAEAPEAQIDRADELQKIWQCERGQLWIIPSKSGKGEHRLLCGDSTKTDDVARVMGGEWAALCVTSPPYFVGKDYEKQFTEGDIITFICDISRQIVNIVSGERRIVINCATTAWSHVNGGKVDYRLNLDWWQNTFRELGWYTRSIRIWSKHGGLLHNAPNADIVDMHWEYLATFYNPTYKHRGQNRVEAGWATSGIWDSIHGARQDVHSAPYPIIIPARFIELYTDIDEIIYDPFGGSGTTMVACEQLARQCRMIEIEPKYCAVILERMFQLTGERPSLVSSE